jgi:hypothetical protein
VLRQLGVFESVVPVAFHSAFHSEMHQNNFFYFLKIILILAYQNDLKTQKKKILI